MKKSKYTVVIIIIAISSAVIALIGSLLYFSENNEAKTITLNITNGSFYQSVELTTREKYLGPAMKNQGLITGHEEKSDYIVTSVRGMKADAENGYHWTFSKDGEPIEGNIFKVKIRNEDIFEIVCRITEK